MIEITAQSPLPTRFHPRVDAGFMVKLFTGIIEQLPADG